MKLSKSDQNLHFTCNEVKQDFIPFNVSQKPIFDNDRFVCFQKKEGKRFGRLDIETMEFEELCHAPAGFGSDNGFYHDGFVYCFDKDNLAMKYECTTGKWHDTSLEMRGKRMIVHPWNNGTAIELMDDGSVRVVNIADRNVLKAFESKYGGIDSYPEMLGLCGAEGEFFLLVCNGGNKRPWKVFSSATDTWTETKWPSTNRRTNTASLMLRQEVFIITSIDKIIGHA